MKTRPPSGRPSWPILLIAGVEKTGKSYSCAAASASDMVGRTFWIGVGEDDPDELGALPGARFEIVEHDGTYRDILTAVHEAAAEPPEDDKPNLIIFDSTTKLWDLLKDEAQVLANRRAAEKAKKYKQTAPDDDVTIGMDLWNRAKGRWGDVIVALKNHRGPVVVTARLEQTTVMENDKPTKHKEWKIQGEKSLTFDVGAIVQIRAFGESYLTGVKSLRWKRPAGELVEYPDFTVEKVWKDLGLTKDVDAQRSHQTSDAEQSVQADEGDLLDQAKDRIWKAHIACAPRLNDEQRREAIVKLIADEGLDAESLEDMQRLAAELGAVDPWAAGQAAQQ